MTPLLVTTLGESSFALRKTSSEVRYFARERTSRRQPFDRFHVVIENVGRGVEHDLDAPFLRVEVGNQHLDDDRGIHRANRFDRSSKMIRAAIFQIVPRDRGNDHMLQTHPAHGLGDALRFVLFQGERFGGVTAQNPQARVQRSPAIIIVAVPWLQHSQRFGHCALSQTVCKTQVRDERLGGKENRIRRQPDLDPGRLLGLVQCRIDFRAGHDGECYSRARSRKVNQGHAVREVIQKALNALEAVEALITKPRRDGFHAGL